MHGGTTVAAVVIAGLLLRRIAYGKVPPESLQDVQELYENWFTSSPAWEAARATSRPGWPSSQSAEQDGVPGRQNGLVPV
jgi:hypothetical protein